MALPAEGNRDDLLIVARVRRPHGVRGEVLAAIETDRPDHVFRRGRSLEVGDRDGAPVQRTVYLERVRPTNRGVILKFRDVGTREDAESFRGTVLLLRPEEAQPAHPDEIHYRDLVGMSAVAAGERIGTVVDIMETGGVELLVVKRADGRDILVPFVKAIVRDIDLSNRELRLDLPEGFLEI